MAHYNRWNLSVYSSKYLITVTWNKPLYPRLAKYQMIISAAIYLFVCNLLDVTLGESLHAAIAEISFDKQILSHAILVIAQW